MFESLLSNAQGYIHSNPWLAFAAVFIGGLLTAANPCVLAMIPLTVGFVSADEKIKSPLSAFTFSSLFVFGLALTFTAMGIAASLFDVLFGQTPAYWNWVVAGACVVMGLHFAGIVNAPIPSLNVNPKIKGGLGAFLLGTLFGLVSAPCAAPILIVLLVYIAGSDSSLLYGASLLLVYALGHCILILIAGTSMGAAKSMLENKKFTETLQVMRRVAGIAIVVVGAYFAYRGIVQ